MQFDVTGLLTHQAYGPRYYWRPPHKPLPSREALVLSTALRPFRQVAETLPLRPEDNQPNPCAANDVRRLGRSPSASCSRCTSTLTHVRRILIAAKYTARLFRDKRSGRADNHANTIE